LNNAASGPVPYRVVYSERTRQRLLALADIARERGDGEAFLAALKEFHRRLCLFPQFGEPLIDLKHESGQVWIGIVRPLAMRYGSLTNGKSSWWRRFRCSFRIRIPKRANDAGQVHVGSLTEAAILILRASTFVQAAPAALPFCSAAENFLDIARLLTEPHRKWAKRPPASDQAIERLQRAARSTLPQVYIDLLRYSNGGEGSVAFPSLYFMLYETEYVCEINESADQRDFYPGHFVIGSNGGLETIAFDTRTPEPWPIVMYDAVAGIGSDIVIAKDIAEFIRAIGVDSQE
jgi:hypothetical protein